MEPRAVEYITTTVDRFIMVWDSMQVTQEVDILEEAEEPLAQTTLVLWFMVEMAVKEPDRQEDMVGTYQVEVGQEQLVEAAEERTGVMVEMEE